MGGAEHHRLQRLGGIDPVAAEGGVGDAAMGEHRLEPVDVEGVVGVVLQHGQHAAPGGKLHPRPPVEAAQRPFDAGAVAARQLVRLVVEQVFQGAGEGEERGLDGGEGLGGPGRGVLHRFHGGAGGALHAAVGLGVGAGPKLIDDVMDEIEVERCSVEGSA